MTIKIIAGNWVACDWALLCEAETKQAITNTEILIKAQYNPANNRQGISDEQGYYEVQVLVGEVYTITASKNGYQPNLIVGIEVSSPGEILVNDFFLEKQQQFICFLPLIFR